MIIFYLIALLIVLTIFQMILKNSVIPESIGLINQQFSPLPKAPHCVSTQAISKKKRIEPLPYLKDFNITKEHLLYSMNKYGGMEIIKDDGNYVHVVFSTKKLHFKDDVELFFDDTLRKVEYRSCSRVGYGDHNLNRARYLDIKNVYLEAF